MNLPQNYIPMVLSLPARGAWIEMVSSRWYVRLGRLVAPRTGSVD